MSGATDRAGGRWAGLTDSSYYLLAAVVGRSAHLLAVPLLVRILSPAEFARFDIALVSITLLATALLLGTDSGAAAWYAKRPPDDRAGLRAIFATSLRVPLAFFAGTAGLLAIVQLAGGLASFDPFLPWLVAANALCMALGNCAAGLLRWTGRARSAAFLIALNGLLPLLVALGMPWVGAASSAWMLAGLLAGRSVAAAVSLAVAHRALGGLRTDVEVVRPRALLAASWTLGAASLAAPARRTAERMLVLALLGESALAAYAVLARLAQVLEVALQALGNGYYPRALRALAQPEGRRLAVQALRLFFAATFLAMLAGWLVARPTLALMAGDAIQVPPALLPLGLALGALGALPYCAGMAYFHANRLSHYAGMLVLAGLLSLALAVAAVALAPGLHAWMLGLLAGNLLAGFLFLRNSERMRPVGYSPAGSAAGLGALGVLAVLPMLLGA